MVNKHCQPIASSSMAEATAGLRPDCQTGAREILSVAGQADRAPDQKAIELRCGDTSMSLRPDRGGCISQFSWRNRDIFRPHKSGARPDDFASFPLVPFCNRIADRRIQVDGADHILPAAPKEIDARHAIHGLGWVNAWSSRQLNERSAELSFDHDGNQWPWAFAANQTIALNESGYTHRLSLTNADAKSMPAGLGLHPYFPSGGAQLTVGADGFWETGSDLLPTKHVVVDGEPDWFGGKTIDHCFTGGGNPVLIEWPTHRLQIHTSANLPFTHVYTPTGAGFFCVEPVSHIPNAINIGSGQEVTGLTILEPGESMEIECRFELEAID